MEDLRKRVNKLLGDLEQTTSRLKLAEKVEEREQIREKMHRPDFWSDSQNAQQLVKREDQLTKQTEPWQIMLEAAKELEELLKLKDESLKKEIEKRLGELEKELEDGKKLNRFNGPYDDHGVILSIHAGAGGTDAQDWAQMLMRMYVRWAESQDVRVKTIDQSAGEEAGIKSATLELTGEYLYGKLAGEHGVHRLVRLSPFNADHLRQTSFAKVEILPLIDKPDAIALDEKNLKIDVFRAGGHGGQSVNTTDSAVRATHLPTSLSVSIQNERSQLKNKEVALNILRSKLVQLSMEQHAKDLSQLKGPNQSAEWGNQIRSYVLHPYKQVKDNRTGYESSEVEKVLNGQLEPLIDAWLGSR